VIQLATLYFASALVAVVVTAVSWIGNLRTARHSRLPALLSAMLALAAALALFGLRGVVGDWLSQCAAELLLIASGLLYRVAVDRLFERGPAGRAALTIAGAAALVVLGATVGDAPRVARAIVGALAVATALALPARALLSGAEAWRGPSRVLAGGVFVFGALAALARAAAVAAGAAPESPVEPSALNLALAVAVLVLVTAASFAFLVMLRERDMGTLAMRDALTGVFNRRALHEEIERVLSLAQRRGLSCSVLLADLDRFSEINVEQGHRAGDEVLRHFVALARGVVRREDVLGRYGGEQFAMLLFATPASGAECLARRLRSALAARPPRIRGAGVALTASFGVAESKPGEPTGAQELLRRADAALAAAKARGRDCVVSYEETAARESG
jgi:diguanylate cyclase (GGDEF)-like protein